MFSQLSYSHPKESSQKFWLGFRSYLKIVKNLLNASLSILTAMESSEKVNCQMC